METQWGPEFVTDPTAASELPVDDVQTEDEDLDLAAPPASDPAANEMREQLVRRLLPVLDDLDCTIMVAQENGEAPSIVEGTQLVRRQIADILEGYGIKPH
ncbi:MAG: nucleotide exchange factor GrpE [Myxococcota bacterium]|nr:nucleotide exchange factor GrpE [Myxococcota bacterium]